ncbi:hypothetical protein LTR66_014324, partial [Elasticomyces elasticus]
MFQAPRVLRLQQLFLAFASLSSLVTALPTSLPVRSTSPSNVLSKRGTGYGGTTKVTSPAGLAWYDPNLGAGTATASTSYKCYHGGINSYPPMSSWMNFYDMFNHNKPTMLARNNNNDQWVGWMWDAITQTAAASNVDARLILAIVMQESTGQIDVGCTGSMPNCGLMQASYNSHSFDPANP